MSCSWDRYFCHLIEAFPLHHVAPAGFLLCFLEHGFCLDFDIPLAISDDFDSIIKIHAFVPLVPNKFCFDFASEMLCNDILDEFLFSQFCDTIFEKFEVVINFL